MKKYTLVLALFILAVKSQAQTTLSFCTTVQDNNCIFNNTKFITSPDSVTAKIYMFIKNDRGFGTTKVSYELFSLDKEGTEKRVNSIEQKVEESWIYAWQPSLLNSPGKYRVKVYNANQELICNKSFEFFNVW